LGEGEHTAALGWDGARVWVVPETVDVPESLKCVVAEFEVCDADEVVPCEDVPASSV